MSKPDLRRLQTGVKVKIPIPNKLKGAWEKIKSKIKVRPMVKWGKKK